MASCVVAVHTQYYSPCSKASFVASSSSSFDIHRALPYPSLRLLPLRLRTYARSLRVQASAGSDSPNEQSQFGLGGPGTWFGFGKRQERAVGRLAMVGFVVTAKGVSSKVTEDCCSTDTEKVTDDVSLIDSPTKATNRVIAFASAAAAVGFFLVSRGGFSGATLGDLAAMALPYDEALSNGRPTVVEFYADWCEVCREMAPDVYKVEQQYKDAVNFVMLNVDNTKWEQELDEFGVEGIPHFAFLDKKGNEEGNIVGRLPKKYLEDNVLALSKGAGELPHTRVVGQFSNPESHHASHIADPRSHGT